MRPSNYDKYPFVQVEETSDSCFEGWKVIGAELNAKLKSLDKKLVVIVIECYIGVLDEEAELQLKKNMTHHLWINAKDAFKDETLIRDMIHPDVTDDRVFGFLTCLNMEDYLSDVKINDIQKKAATVAEGVIVVYGTGASLLLSDFDLLVYADMARWEIQMRMRRNEINNLGLFYKQIEFSEKYKQGFFVDWRVCDRLKKKIFSQLGLFTGHKSKESTKIGDRHRHKERAGSYHPTTFSRRTFFRSWPLGRPMDEGSM